MRLRVQDAVDGTDSGETRVAAHDPVHGVHRSIKAMSASASTMATAATPTKERR